MRIAEAFIPPFLKSADRWLLLNNPHIWATRIHILLFWVGLLNAGWFLWGRFFPVNIQDIPNQDDHLFFIVITQIIAFLYWVYQMKIRGVEQAFGRVTSPTQTRDTLITLAGVTLISLMILSFQGGMQLNIRSLISSNQLVKDVNAMNLGQSILFPEYNGRGTMSPNHFNPLETGLPLTLSLNEKELSREELARIVKSISTKEEEIRYLKAFIETSNKFRMSPFAYQYAILSPKVIFSQLPDSGRNEILKTSFYEKYGEDNAYISNPVNSEVVDNIRKVSQSYKPISRLASPTEMGVFFFVTGWLTLILMAFKRTNLREMAIAGIAGFCMSFTGGAMSYIIGELYHVVFYSGYLLLILFVFVKRNHPRMLMLQRAGLALLVAASPLLTLFLLYPDNSDSIETVFPLGVLVAFILWFWAFNPRFMQLLAQPKNQ